MNFKVKIWKQKHIDADGQLVDFEVDDLSESASTLDLLDKINETQKEKNEEPVAFDHACRKANCGQCSLVINGIPHGPEPLTASCQMTMDYFKNGSTITIEPFRAKALPIIQDLKVDRSAITRILGAGGFMHVPSTGGFINKDSGSYLPPIPAGIAGSTDFRFNASSCINCAACVAACKNSSAMLYTSVKVFQLNSLETEESEKEKRVINMLTSMDEEGFGNCSNYGECEAVCPKGLSLNFISEMNREYAKASLKQVFRK